MCLALAKVSFGASRIQKSALFLAHGPYALCVKPSSFRCWESDVIDELLSQIGKHLTLNILCHAVGISFTGLRS